MRICLVLEGCYPYVHGGVSTWMHQYITVMKEHEFVLWVIGAHACDRGKFVYELPDNVVEVHEVFLDDALKLKEHGNQNGQLHRINHFSEEETKSLRDLSCDFNRIRGTSCLPWRICLQKTGITYRAWDIHKRKGGRDHQGKMGNPII